MQQLDPNTALSRIASAGKAVLFTIDDQVPQASIPSLQTAAFLDYVLVPPGTVFSQENRRVKKTESTTGQTLIDDAAQRVQCPNSKLQLCEMSNDKFSLVKIPLVESAASLQTHPSLRVCPRLERPVTIAIVDRKSPRPGAVGVVFQMALPNTKDPTEVRTCIARYYGNQISAVGVKRPENNVVEWSQNQLILPGKGSLVAVVGSSLPSRK
jgi:hypothetical protein